MDPRIFRVMMKEVTDLLETIAVSDMFPRLRWVDWATGLDARIARTASKLDDVLERTLQEHERSEGEACDLLDDLLSAIKEEGGQGVQLDRVDVKGLIFDLFVAGIDTTSKAIEWAMPLLVKNPGEMARVQQEVRRVAGAHQGAVQDEQLGKMSRLQAALKEAMRLHPPVLLLIPRETIQDTKLHGYDVAAGTRVISNAWAIGRDGRSWESAEEFLPERFLHDAAVDYSGKDFRFIPFSAGRRGCPGTAFATRLAELALASLVYHFDWELPEGQEVESFEVVESSGLSPALKSPLILVAKPLQA
ncbi:hypothetical protein BS78_09G202000 [Paspalum vaginatum]|nr:hypothetical protein BS78_09G202000 [Paspalum vaginatum]